MKVWCAAFECIHNKNNLCKAKEINLSDSYVNTLYEGQMHCQKCRMYEEDEETKQIKKNIEEWWNNKISCEKIDADEKLRWTE